MPMKTPSGMRFVLPSSEPRFPTRREALLLLGIIGPLVAGPTARAQQTLHAIASFSILGDLMKNVGGERVAVTTLVGPNADVHVYSPSPGDVKSIATATAVVINGLGLEGWMTRLITASGTKAAVVTASQGVKPLEIASGRHAGQIDPHAWQSVANAKIYVVNIRDGFSAADGDNKDYYETKANSYLAKLDALDKEVKEAIGRVPPDRRKVITTHHAFGYFAEAYGVEFISPEGVSTDAEPSAKDLANIVAQIRTQKISAIFMENISDPRLVQQIAHDTGVGVGGTLYSDALSEPKGPAGTYIDMIRHNVREITKALTS
jgi:zinc/manganese transport system substrate-binding protein